MLASSALAVPALAGDALPTGGSVAAGQVGISSANGAMTVNQGSDRAVVNWQGFNVGEGNSVNFVQPDVHSAILNRVTGSTGSTIAGSLSGNGQVFLVNPNGIAITKTGTVKVGGGFAASTLDIADDDFLKGKLNFHGNGSSATVSNEGVISIGRGGYVALMGGKVKNDGLVAVPYGKAGFGAGEAIALDLSGDGFMQVAVASSGEDDGAALIDNSGTVTAEGGVIVMKAATARNAARNAINMSGVAEARSVSGRNGKITFGGGAGGKVTVSGKVSTRAKKTAAAPAHQSANIKGGVIEVTGLQVALNHANIDASGFAGGGTIRIGGDYQGTGTLQRAETLTVSADTRISADAITTGNGGSVVLWSDKRTDFAGTISARGATGKGGDAEVSGKAVLAYTGFADLTGAQGFGTLLLDPYNVTVSDGADKTSSGFTASDNDSVINVTTLTNALAGANVTISTGSGGAQDGNITIANAVNWSSNSVLTLDAANDIFVAANVTATGDSGGLALTFGGDYWLANGAAITLSGTNATFQVNDTNYTLIHSLSDLESVNNSLGGNYALAVDVDASGKKYTTSVIGKEYSSIFTGTFAGLGHVISDLTIEAPMDYVGLFGHVMVAYSGGGGVIRDIGLEDGSVTGFLTVGGLVGHLNYGTIMQSYVTGTVTGKESVGGLVGWQSGGTISASYATGQFGGLRSYVGGLVGRMYEDGTVEQSYATGRVLAGGEEVGGLVGYMNLGTITQSYATATVAGKGKIGGLVGWQSGGTIEQSYATGKLKGKNNVGGLVGFHDGGRIEQSYFDTYTTGKSKSTGNRYYFEGKGLTTAQAHSASSYAGWDFETVWVPPGDGHYPELYALSDVVFVKTNDANMIYGSALLETGSAGDLGEQEQGVFGQLSMPGSSGTQSELPARDADIVIVDDLKLRRHLCGAGGNGVYSCGN
nr:GLUG motif-containing protein [Marinicella sp. W31]MDC2877431.1 GLUG motif-containing protein [Marinicella sp. W31]